MSFPSNPVNGQTTVTNNITYIYSSAGTGYWTRSYVNTSTLAATVASLNINNTTQSINTESGALIVAGGASIGKNLYVGGNGVFTGELVISSTGTISGIFNILNTTSSTSTASGALVVRGGVGIGDNLNVGNGANIIGITTVTNTTQSTTTNTGALQIINGGAGIGGNVNIGGRLKVTGLTTITNTTNSTSTATGALQVAGGVGIGGDLYVGGKIVANELDIQLTTVTTTLIVTDDVISTKNTTPAVSSSSGALQVAGGVGIGGKIFVGTMDNTTGTNIVYFNAATGEFTYGLNFGVPQAGGAIIANTFANPLSLTNQNTATDATTGALQVAGGIGVKGSIYTAQKIGWTSYTTATVSRVYQFYNPATNSLDTVFG